jgi:hypothetical protein
MEVVTYRHYHNVRNKESIGTPTMIALDYQIQSPSAYVWPIPTQDYTVIFLAITRLKDMDTAAGNPPMPERFINALVYGLADDLADEYGTPINERNRIAAKAEKFFHFAKASDRERPEHEVVASAFIMRD